MGAAGLENFGWWSAGSSWVKYFSYCEKLTVLDLFLLVDCVRRVAGMAAEEFGASSLSVPVTVSVPVVLSVEHIVLERCCTPTRVLVLADVAMGFPSLSVMFEVSIPRLEAFSVKLFSISASVAVAFSVVIPKTSWRYSDSSSSGGELATAPTRSAGDNDNEVSLAIPSVTRNHLKKFRPFRPCRHSRYPSELNSEWYQDSRRACGGGGRGRRRRLKCMYMYCCSNNGNRMRYVLKMRSDLVSDEGFP